MDNSRAREEWVQAFYWLCWFQEVTQLLNQCSDDLIDSADFRGHRAPQSILWWWPTFWLPVRRGGKRLSDSDDFKYSICWGVCMFASAQQGQRYGHPPHLILYCVYEYSFSCAFHRALMEGGRRTACGWPFSPPSGPGKRTQAVWLGLAVGAFILRTISPFLPCFTKQGLLSLGPGTDRFG